MSSRQLKNCVHGKTEIKSQGEMHTEHNNLIIHYIPRGVTACMTSQFVFFPFSSFKINLRADPQVQFQVEIKVINT